MFTPLQGIVEDYVDTNRNGVISPLDLLRYRELLFGTPPATQAWKGETANHLQP